MSDNISQKRPRPVDEIRADLAEAIDELQALVAFDHEDFVRFRHMQGRVSDSRLKAAVTQLEIEYAFFDSLYNSLADSADSELKNETVALRDAMINHLADNAVASAAAADARRTRAMGPITSTRTKAARPQAVPGAPPVVAPPPNAWPDAAHLKLHNLPRVERLAPPNFAWRASTADLSSDLTALAAARAAPPSRPAAKRDRRCF